MTSLIPTYLGAVEAIAEGQRWYESRTAYRFSAALLTVAGAQAPANDLRELAEALKKSLDRVDPLRGFIMPMAAMALSQQMIGTVAIARLEAALESLASLPRSPGRTHRARAVPLLAFGGPEPSIITADRLITIHQAWDRRHPWMTTGRHYSFAAIGAITATDPEDSAERADRLHDLLGAGGYWHEWDASILLSFHPNGVEEAQERYELAVAGFTGGARRPPPMARDDLAVVAMVDTDPETAGSELKETYEHLRTVRPRPSNQVAMAISAGLTLAAGSTPGGWQRPLVDGFLMYGFAEALNEESSD